MNNDIKSITYMDLTVQGSFKAGRVGLRPYITANDLLDVTAPIFSPACRPGQCVPTNTAIYDVVGR